MWEAGNLCGNLMNLGKRCRAGGCSTWLEHLTALPPADGICVGSIIVAWSQLDLCRLPPGTAVAVLVPASSSPQCATCAVIYCTDLPQPHQLQVLYTCI